VRAHVVEETVRLMRELWTQDAASFAGEFRRLSPSRSWPKPAQKPHPPVLLGVPASGRNFRRAAAWADGWIPMSNPILERVYVEWLTGIRRAWQDAGRDPTTCRITALLTRTATHELPRIWQRARDLGLERILVKIPEASESDTLKLLDAYTEALTTR
jgi:alkanesulfonate monooxygenase SsuD/methylene tetrahydromethanopterin reductase-like flavin-dependent oxidoreductase (luciferase family)